MHVNSERQKFKKQIQIKNTINFIKFKDEIINKFKFNLQDL